LFSGVGLTIFLYYLSAALVLKLPPEVIARIPVELEPVLKIIWLLGVIPAMSGMGHIIAGLLIRPPREQPKLEQPENPPQLVNFAHGSVTDHTTNLLEPQKAQKAQN
jgi:hypothetical protein